MTRPLRLHVPGLPAHVMSRGNAKQRIFRDTGDCQRFLDLLAQTTRRFEVECHGYCLMVTHYHLTLRPGPQPVARMMQQLNSAYAEHFNWKHRRVGHVLQGRYKGLLVEGDDSFLRMLRYLVRNPIEARMVTTLDEWRWSSYRATVGLDPAPAFLSLDPVWAMFDSTDRTRAQQQFAEFAAIPDDLEPFLSALFFGSAHLGRALTPKLEPTRHVREYTYRQRYADRPPLHELLPANQGDLQRTRAMQDAFSRYAYTLREIAEVVGCHPTTVWRRIRGLAAAPFTMMPDTSAGVASRSTRRATAVRQPPSRRRGRRRARRATIKI